VVVDAPHNGPAYGAMVAAPIWRRIAEAALRQMAVTPTINPPPVVLATARPDASARQVSGPVESTEITLVGGAPVMPDVRGLSARDALRVLGAAGLSVRVTGSGVVTAQTPEPGSALESGGSSVLELHRGSR
jgi:hypothetical protein